jgi:L-ascorbate metabolism protein UlaG (beta-lactamase superfamily)
MSMCTIVGNGDISMRTHAARSFSVLALCLAVGVLAAHLRAAAPPNRRTDAVQTSAGELRITPLYHGSVMLEFGGKVIHIDPWSQADYAGLPAADLIFVTHTHADHLDRSMIDKLHKPSTIIVASPAGTDTLNCAPACGNVETISNGEKTTVMGIGIEAVAMYNLVQGPAPGKPFHHKGIGNGYILGFGTTRVYFSGDTECVPEIKALKNIDVAFVAMNPPRTMSTIEAAECVKAFRPKIVYPYHYRGSRTEEFADALKGSPGIEVRLRKLEGEPQ